jgi:hypothetical protein
MSKIAVSSPASGTATYTISAPSGSTDRTITLPDATGTILTTATAGVPVNGPAFSAYLSANQTVSGSTYTKVAFNTELFDTNSNFDTSLSRFTPTVSGYYQINFSVYFQASTATAVLAALYKNGTSIRRFDCYSNTANGLDDWSTNGSTLVYMNGSTDYLEVYGFLVTGSPAFTGGQAYSTFEGFLARSAT